MPRFAQKRFRSNSTFNARKKSKKNPYDAPTRLSARTPPSRLSPTPCPPRPSYAPYNTPRTRPASVQPPGGGAPGGGAPGGCCLAGNAPGALRCRKGTRHAPERRTKG
ncbi:hypothetical protein T484DRAFT_1753767 [Baffinella frigidus]|nr:hypothetical protein T484DRAFT_1753767 [Cryptophyta sp. CCMP2293]